MNSKINIVMFGEERMSKTKKTRRKKRESTCDDDMTFLQAVFQRLSDLFLTVAFVLLILVLLVIMFFVPFVFHRWMTNTLYGGRNILVFDEEIVRILSLLPFWLIVIFVIVYWMRNRNKKKGKFVVEMSNKQLFWQKVFLCFSIVIVIWSFIPFARLDLNQSEFQHRNMWAKYETYPFYDIEKVTFDYEYGNGQRYRSDSGFITFEFSDGEKVRIGTTKNRDMIYAILILNPEAKCFSTSDFEFQKSYVFAGTTKRQEVSKILQQIVEEHNLEIPNACHWLLNDHDGAPRPPRS